MSEINISEIPVETFNRGLSPTVNYETNAIEYHTYLSPNFSQNAEDYGLNQIEQKYTLTVQHTNRGKTNGHEWRCKNCRLKIPIGQPMIRITSRETIDIKTNEGGTMMPIFKSWLFGNEECCRKWLSENDLELML